MIVIMMIMIIVIIIINIIMSMGLPNTPSRSKHAGGHYPTHTTPQRGKGGEPPKPTPGTTPHHREGGSNPQPHHTTPQAGEGSNPQPHHTTGGGGGGGTIGGGEGGGGAAEPGSYIQMNAVLPHTSLNLAVADAFLSGQG